MLTPTKLGAVAFLRHRGWIIPLPNGNYPEAFIETVEAAYRRAHRGEWRRAEQWLDEADALIVLINNGYSEKRND